jgi:hypothetical protein
LLEIESARLLHLHRNGNVARRIADGVRISKSSKIGELSFGFARQKFSGGATTQWNPLEGGNGLLAGAEFGSKNFKQFAPRTPRYGVRGNEGYFIYPTLRQIQPELIAKWETAFDRILKEWELMAQSRTLKLSILADVDNLNQS